MEDLEVSNTYQNNENESLQNRFSAYLVTAVTNKRIRYIEKMKKLKLKENIQSLILFLLTLFQLP